MLITYFLCTYQVSLLVPFVLAAEYLQGPYLGHVPFPILILLINHFLFPKELLLQMELAISNKNILLKCMCNKRKLTQRRQMSTEMNDMHFD